MAELGIFQIYKGRDPFTPPQTKLVWVPTSIPGIKTPVTKFRWMNSSIEFVIEGPDVEDVKKAFEGCMTRAAIRSAVAAIIAGYASGGSAAASAAGITFTIEVDRCVELTLSRVVDITSTFRNNSGWDEDWS